MRKVGSLLKVDILEEYLPEDTFTFFQHGIPHFTHGASPGPIKFFVRGNVDRTVIFEWSITGYGGAAGRHCGELSVHHIKKDYKKVVGSTCHYINQPLFHATFPTLYEQKTLEPGEYFVRMEPSFATDMNDWTGLKVVVK